jgi:uncharacterized small protein (DUF1192 family)
MDWDELKPWPKPAIALGDPLTTLSIAELEARIAALRQEIERVEQEIKAKRAHEDAAQALFKR